MKPLRTWSSGRLRLELFNTATTDWLGQTRLAYEFWDGETLVFSGSDFCGSPLHSDDSDETVAALLGFLSLRPGDTDREYFDRYTAEQLAWARAHGEELSLLSSELEERARRGFVGCDVKTHFSAWHVTFNDGTSLLLQTDYDQAAFAVACGLVKPPADWDGAPSKLGDEWLDLDPSLITGCPRDYLDLAEAVQ